MFSDEVCWIRCCARLEKLTRYEEGARDLVMLQLRFVVKWEEDFDVTPHTQRARCIARLRQPLDTITSYICLD
jgi:hypothetical protein